MKSLLIDIDTQNDFINKDGALSVPDAELIRPKLHDLFIGAIRKGVPIISTMDTHTSDDPEFATYPPHCIRETMGWDKIRETKPYRSSFVSISDDNATGVPKKTLEQCMQFMIYKKTYDVWDSSLGNPNAIKDVLDYFKPLRIMLCGVATDICVVAAAKGIAKWASSCGYEPSLWVIKDAVRGLSLDSEVEAFSTMMNYGFIRTDSKSAICMM